MSAESTGDNRNDFYQSRLERFDRLMTTYLAGRASDQEKKELQHLTENGFEERFREWLDMHFRADVEIENLPGKTRQEILTNILGAASGKPKAAGRWRWGWAAAVLLALGSALWLVMPDTAGEQWISAGAGFTNEGNEPIVIKGKQFLYLPDGSSVLMNEGAELSYSPASFENGAREVTLSGEAYFDIAHNPGKPFLVHTGPIITRVLGTAFNVSMKQKEVVITVTRGLVEVGGGNRVYAQIRPDEQIIVDTETRQYNTVSLSAEEEIAWKKTCLIFDNIDLEEAGRLVGEHYGVALAFEHAETVKCRITASFLNEEDLGTVLRVISEMIGASYTIEGNKARITGGSCEGAAR
ncbi:MAG: hypothetical protein ABS46_12695 [Cytophagaceae bacterium SCN 52-12]|nr:MAG: hypothetical protein ABS46_12695 [Cytophagaceae bacterium SCN 52-12]